MVVVVVVGDVVVIVAAATAVTDVDDDDTAVVDVDACAPTIDDGAVIGRDDDRASGAFVSLVVAAVHALRLAMRRL